MQGGGGGGKGSLPTNFQANKENMSSNNLLLASYFAVI